LKIVLAGCFSFNEKPNNTTLLKTTTGLQIQNQ